ncbi:ATP-dependent Clp protease proteolytic subunit 5, chloroplastic, partial [Mucuna pruriens]
MPELGVGDGLVLFIDLDSVLQGMICKSCLPLISLPMHKDKGHPHGVGAFPEYYIIIYCGGAVDDDMAKIIVAQLFYRNVVDPNKGGIRGKVLKGILGYTEDDVVSTDFIYDQNFLDPSHQPLDGMLGFAKGKTSLISQLNSHGWVRNVVGHYLNAQGGCVEVVITIQGNGPFACSIVG